VKKLLITILLGFGLVANVMAGSSGTMKILTGDYGGVVSIQKKAYTSPEGSRLNGLLTVSDVAYTFVRNDIVDGDFTAAAIEEQGVVVIDDIRFDEDGVRRTRISGRVGFNGDSVPGSSLLTFNGYFRVFYGPITGITLQSIVVERVDGELFLSGTVIVGDEEWEINDAPEYIQILVRRIFSFIKSA